MKIFGAEFTENEENRSRIYITSTQFFFFPPPEEPIFGCNVFLVLNKASWRLVTFITHDYIIRSLAYWAYVTVSHVDFLLHSWGTLVFTNSTRSCQNSLFSSFPFILLFLFSVSLFLFICTRLSLICHCSFNIKS